jgi:hypothetical protein
MRLKPPPQGSDIGAATGLGIGDPSSLVSIGLAEPTK